MGKKANIVFEKRGLKLPEYSSNILQLKSLYSNQKSEEN